MGEKIESKTGSRIVGLEKEDAKLELEYLCVFPMCLVAMLIEVSVTVFSFPKFCAELEGSLVSTLPLFWVDILLFSPSLFSALGLLLDLFNSLFEAFPL
jgi:hypothetical protein